jgi:type IV secretion system protein VirD4
MERFDTSLQDLKEDMDIRLQGALAFLRRQHAYLWYAGAVILVPVIATRLKLFEKSAGYYPATGDLRLKIILLALAAGFVLGWFLSPRLAVLRNTLLILGGGLLCVKAVSDNGQTGWTLTVILAVLGFSFGFGVWFRLLVGRLGETPSTFGSARWASFDHLRRNRAFGLSGFRLGYFPAGKKWFPLHYAGDRHLLTVAPTRSGKGATMIISNLLTYAGSALVVDPKGENALITAQRRYAMGQSVHVVDPWGLVAPPGASARFNPLDWLDPADPDITENAMILADALAVKQGNNDPFWSEEAKALLQGVILYVATESREQGQRHLGRVRDLLLLDGEDMLALFRRMAASEHHVVASTGARCLQKEEKLLSNVVASAQAQTHFLDSPRIRASLSASDFKFDDLKATPMTVYLVLPVDRLAPFGRWLRLLIQQALTINARNIADKPERPILFLLDEMAALGRLAMIEQAYGLMAGFGMQLWGIVQDFSQLKTIYGEGYETFVSNAGVIQYFGSRDRATAEYFSALCGVTTVWNFSTALARSFGVSGNHGNSSESSTDTTAATQRKLAYPDELMRIDPTRQILLIEHLDPILAHRRRWFNDPELKTLGRNLHDA